MTGTMSASPVEAFSRWGSLPIAIVLAVLLGARLGALLLPRSLPRERALFGSVSALAVIVGCVRVLGAVGLLSSGAILGCLFMTTAGACLLHRNRRVGWTWQGALTRETFPVAIVGAASVIVTGVAAYLLPVWQWDSLGYHLPYVNFALQSRGFAGVPEDMPYVATYPHVVENFFIAWRAMLPDDRLIDSAQIPFGILGALSVGVLARQAGAAREHAVAAGLLWLTIPAVFLQLPTDYVDVAAAALLLAAAAFTLAEPTPAHVLGAGMALGLFVGSKANAPIGATLLFGVLAVRAFKAGRRQSIFVAAAAILLLGGESYILNLVRHGNPIWPVQLKIGSWKLPGDVTLDTLLAAGCGAPRVTGSLPVRLLRSWTAIDAPPMFDMRYGGFGLPFLLALPVTAALVIQRRSVTLGVVLAATLASPDPAVPRYVLAFPGVILALASSRLCSLRWLAGSPWLRQAVWGFTAVAAAAELYRAYPSLAGEGPPLGAYLQMTEADRLRAVGADGSPAPFYDALERLEPGKTTAFDSSLELSYLAWPSDLSRRATRISDHASAVDAARLLADPNVGLLIVGDGSPVAKTALEAGSRFTEVFRCRKNIPPCVVETAAAASARDHGHLLDILNLRWPSCVVLLRR